MQRNAMPALVPGEELLFGDDGRVHVSDENSSLIVSGMEGAMCMQPYDEHQYR